MSFFLWCSATFEICLLIEKMFEEVPFSAKQSSRNILRTSYFVLFVLPKTYFWTIGVPETHCVPRFFFAAIPILHESMHCFAISNWEIHYFSLFSFICEKVFQKWFGTLALRIIPFEQALSRFQRCLDFWIHSKGCSRVEIATQTKSFYHGAAFGHVC